MNHALARQVLGQAPPGRPEAGGLYRLGDGRRGGQAFGRVGLQRLDEQFELLDPLADLLGGGAEPRPLQPVEFEAQLLDQGVGLDRLARHADDQTLECVDVVGQQGRIESHANSLSLAEGAPHNLGPAYGRLGGLPQPAILGRSVRSGARQSMPSSSMASWAGVNAAAVPAVAGQTKRPFSRRLANRPRPWPSHHSP